MVGSAPAFWWKPRPTPVARILQPLGMIYGGVTAQRMTRRGFDPGLPVICVGNFVAGGAGKTPVVIGLVERLLARGARPAILTRGYGGASGRAAVVEVDPAGHDAAAVGDEPLLLARIAPTFVARDRAAAARAARTAGADILVLDDGLQSPALAKSVAIAVVDGDTGVGNGLCVPAGPLRAPLGRQWPAASLLCVMGPGSPGDRLAGDAATLGIPVMRARLAPEERMMARLRDRPVFAFAGIGRPEKFFDMLGTHGVVVAGRRAFPDHHAFSASDRRDLLRLAREAGAELVTTEKDQVRLPADFPAAAVAVALVVDDDAPFNRLLDRATSRRA